MKTSLSGHPTLAGLLLVLLAVFEPRLALAGDAALPGGVREGGRRSQAPPSAGVNGQYVLDIPGFRPEMLRSDTWIRTLAKPDEVVLTPRQVEAFNRENVSHCEKLADIRRFRRSLRGDEVRAWIAAVSKRPEKPLFRDGKPLPPAFLDQVAADCALDRIPGRVRVRFAVTVRRTEMRSFPTPVRVFSEADDYEFDRFIETTLYPLEPLAILHASRDGAWLFAQGRNYAAWIAARDVAFAGNGEIFSVLDRKEFLVVTGKAVATGFDPVDPDVSETRLDMGVRVPLARKREVPERIDGRHPMGNYVVRLPTRDRRGALVWKLGLISMSDDVSVGYLPYTRGNIVRQAFKFLGERYGWGGLFNARDCSSFILDTYRTVGLQIPRNAGEQGKLSSGRFYGFTDGMPLAERIRAMERIPPVTPVYMDGHAMLYLNKSGEDFFIIHDFISLRTRGEGKAKSIRTRAVFVTPLLHTFLSSGKTYLEGLYGAREFIPDGKDRP